VQIRFSETHAPPSVTERAHQRKPLGGRSEIHLQVGIYSSCERSPSNAALPSAQRTGESVGHYYCTSTRTRVRFGNHIDNAWAPLRGIISQRLR
jgi:hypothetical protein